MEDDDFLGVLKQLTHEALDRCTDVDMVDLVYKLLLAEERYEEE